jgi:hemerythrin-like domain-containing protein
MLPNSQTEQLEANYQNLLELCDVLEIIADSLPQPDPGLCLATADVVQILIEDTHSLEEDVLFPLLAATARPEVNQTMARLRQEHRADSVTAEEVSEALRDIATGRSVLSADAVGYLLRSFFDSMRRHVYGELEMMQLFVPRADARTIH